MHTLTATKQKEVAGSRRVFGSSFQTSAISAVSTIEPGGGGWRGQGTMNKALVAKI